MEIYWKPDEKDPPATGACVYHGDGEINQPLTFRFCPLGAQVYTRKPIAECELLEFRATVPDKHGQDCEVECTGLVVHCCRTDNKEEQYRVWVKFLDLPAGVSSRLERICKESRYICPFCETY